MGSRWKFISSNGVTLKLELVMLCKNLHSYFDSAVLIHMQYASNLPKLEEVFVINDINDMTAVKHLICISYGYSPVKLCVNIWFINTVIFFILTFLHQYDNSYNVFVIKF